MKITKASADDENKTKLAFAQMLETTKAFEHVEDYQGLLGTMKTIKAFADNDNNQGLCKQWNQSRPLRTMETIKAFADNENNQGLCRR